MRRLGAASIGILLVAAVPLAAQAAPTPAEQRAEAMRIFRQAIEHEKAAANQYPFEEEEAIAELQAAAAKLDEMKQLDALPRSVRTRAARAAAADRQTSEEMPFTDSGEWELMFQDMRWAMEVKREGMELTARESFKARDKKLLPPTRVRAPACESQSETVSSCYTVDSWVIYVAVDARRAHCDFRDGNGKRLTNLDPLFDEVVQRLTCKLTDQTKVVGGSKKRIVRAKLRLTALSGMSPGGSAQVSVTALWR